MCIYIYVYTYICVRVCARGCLFINHLYIKYLSNHKQSYFTVYLQ